MGWETRENGSRYYYRSYRLNGRVHREYVGSGLAGELAELDDRLEREQRMQNAQAIREAVKAGTESEAGLVEFDSQVELIYRALLVRAGLKQHNRGDWRKRNE